MSDPKVTITVATRYLTEQFGETQHKFAFAYRITIRNESAETLQLINRYWLITDANGKSSEVQGSGVVGKQPVLERDEEFEYSSGAIIETPVGNMQGYYEMKRADGSMFKVPIPVFRLAVPNIVN